MDFQYVYFQSFDVGKYDLTEYKYYLDKVRDPRIADKQSVRGLTSGNGWEGKRKDVQHRTSTEKTSHSLRKQSFTEKRHASFLFIFCISIKPGVFQHHHHHHQSNCSHTSNFIHWGKERQSGSSTRTKELKLTAQKTLKCLKILLQHDFTRWSFECQMAGQSNARVAGHSTLTTFIFKSRRMPHSLWRISTCAFQSLDNVHARGAFLAAISARKQLFAVWRRFEPVLPEQRRVTTRWLKECEVRQSAKKGYHDERGMMRWLWAWVLVCRL